MKNLSISNAKNCLIFSIFFSFSTTSFSQKVEQHSSKKLFEKESHIVAFDAINNEKIDNNVDFKILKPTDFGSLSMQDRLDESNRPGMSVEIIDKRTEFSKTVKNTDGSFSQTTSSLPVNYFENGIWRPIDSSIEPTDSDVFIFSNEKNSIKSYYPANLGSGFEVEIKGSEGIKDMLFGSFYTDNNYDKKPFLSSAPNFNSETNVLTYALSDFLDLQVTNRQGLRKIDYVIDSPNFFNSLGGDFLIFEETIDLPENYIISNDDEGLFIANADSEIIARLGPGIYKDASTHEKHEAPTFLEGEYVINQLNNGNYTLQLKIPMSWLTDSERIFPITIDPTLTVGDTYVYGDYYNWWRDNGANNRQVTSSGTLAGDYITSVEFTISNATYYYNGSACGPSVGWFNYTLTGSAGTSVSGCSGNYEQFDNEDPDQTWTVTASDLGGGTDYIRYAFDIVVTYFANVVNPPVSDFTASAM